METNERLKKIKTDLEKWKNEHPTMAYFISHDDADFLIEIAEAYQNAKFCKCP